MCVFLLVHMIMNVWYRYSTHTGVLVLVVLVYWYWYWSGTGMCTCTGLVPYAACCLLPVACDG